VKATALTHRKPHQTKQMKRNDKVKLSIPSSRPIKTMDGNLHEANQVYKVLGTCGTFLRLSRMADCAKLIISPTEVIAA